MKPAPGFTRYRSHKVVEAAPIAAAEFAADRSGRVALQSGEIVQVPAGFYRKGSPPAEGDMLVRYPDGYLSWSPRQAFLDGYTSAAPADWRERLIRERDELADRLDQLRRALLRPGFFEPGNEAHELLNVQARLMSDLCGVLDARIKATAE